MPTGSIRHVTTPNAELKPVYLILSDQSLLVEQALNRMRKRFEEQGGGVFAEDTFDCENASGDDIVGSANILPFISDRRLVIVRNVDKLNKEGLDALSVYVADPAPTTVLVLSGKKLAKNTRLYKAVDKLGGVVERNAPKGRELEASVRGLFTDRGRSMDAAGAELLVVSVGKDLQRLSTEVDKIISFAGDRVELTRSDVEQVVAHTAETSVFAFADALAERQCGRALTLLDGVLRDGANTVLGAHFIAVRTIRDLIAARAMLDRGTGSAGQLAKVLGRQEWQIRRLPVQARGFSSDELVELLRAAAKAEAEMKTSRDARLALERWVVRVCRG